MDGRLKKDDGRPGAGDRNPGRLSPSARDGGRATTDPLSWDAIAERCWEPPVHLSAFDGLRPRLFLTKARLAHLKARDSAVHRELRKIIREKADRYIGEAPPSDFTRENDMRAAGRGVPWLALAYLLDGDAKFLEGAREWMRAICGFPHWEQDNSLSGGECLFGLSVGYDWLHGQLGEDERQSIRARLIRQARAMRDGPPVHHDRWLANHNHVEHLGLAVAGFALYGEAPEAVQWIGQADRVFQAFFEVASKDGSSTEGHQYWAYTTESVLRYAELARDLLNRNYYGSEWLKRVPDFVIHSLLPGFNAEGCVMSFGDSHRTYHSHGPTHLLFRLAAEYRHAHAQWLAEAMLQRGVGRGDYCTWADLLWYDETLQAKPISSLPTFRHCQDIGWATGRSGWDDEAVMVGFKCGPMHGRKAQTYYETHPCHEIGGGHGHPDVNSFQVYACGKWLAIDPGYERPKWTHNHNTVLVNGQGQLGEGQTWFDREAVLQAGASSAIVNVETCADYDYLVGDAENIYPESAGLTRFHRHFLYLKPDAIVIADELNAERPAHFDWLLHTEIGFGKHGERLWIAENGDVRMDVHLLFPQEVRARAEGSALTVSLGPAADTHIVTVLHPRKQHRPVSTARIESLQNRRMELVIASGRKEFAVSLDLEEQKVRLSRNMFTP